VSIKSCTACGGKVEIPKIVSGNTPTTVECRCGAKAGLKIRMRTGRVRGLEVGGFMPGIAFFRQGSKMIK